MASPNLIPKEQPGTYERWELNSFDVPGKRRPIALTTAAQVEAIHQQAQRDGFEAGLKEGRQYAAAQAQRLAALAAAFSSETVQLDEQLAQHVLDVALDVARQMLRGALEVRPELVLPIIQDAIRSLPVLGEQRRLRLHPEDAALAREFSSESLNNSGWSIVEDSAISRGGCVVTTSHGEVDATPEARWRRIVGTLGRECAWLETDKDKGTA